MKKRREWIKLPTLWIQSGGLKEFKWSAAEGADNLAALMALTAIAQHTELETGIATITYDALTEVTSLSRAKLSAGIGILHGRGLVTREPLGRSTYGLAGFSQARDWAKFPGSGMYREGRITMFADFHLRRRVELDALKLLFLFAARRDRAINVARLSYDKITSYSGMSRDHVRSGLSMLVNHDLVQIDRTPGTNEHALASAYRLTLIDPHRHMGTTGRSEEARNALIPAT